MDRISLIKKEYLIVLLTLSLLLLLYLTRIPPVYIDEMWHIDCGWTFVKTGRLALSAYGDTLNANIIIFQPPLFNLLLGLWFKFFGLGLFQARLLIVIISTLILFFTFLIGKTLYNDRIGIVSSILLFFWWFSLFRFTRYDIPVSLFFLIGFYLLLRAEGGKGKFIKYFFSGLFCGLASITHLYGGIGAISIFILFISKYKYKQFFKRELILFIIGVMLPLSIYALYLYPYLDIYSKQASIFASGRFSIFSLNFYFRNIMKEIERWQYPPSIVFLFSFVLFLILYYKKRKVHSKILTVIFTFIILFSLFISNKTFVYAAAVAPFIAIASSILWLNLWDKFSSKLSLSAQYSKAVLCAVITLIIIFRPAYLLYKVWYKYGVKESNLNTYLQNLRKYIPTNSIVLGQYAYWIGFPDNIYYEEFMVTAMKRLYNISFSTAVRAKKIEYIIVDETLLHYQRDPDIEPYLANHCILIGSIKNKLYSNYPGHGTEDDGITRVYKVKT